MIQVKQVQRNWITLQLTQLQVNKIMYIDKIGYMDIILMFDECLKTTLETKNGYVDVTCLLCVP